MNSALSVYQKLQNHDQNKKKEKRNKKLKDQNLIIDDSKKEIKETT